MNKIKNAVIGILTALCLSHYFSYPGPVQEIVTFTAVAVSVSAILVFIDRRVFRFRRSKARVVKTDAPKPCLKERKQMFFAIPKKDPELPVA